MTSVHASPPASSACPNTGALVCQKVGLHTLLKYVSLEYQSFQDGLAAARSLGTELSMKPMI